MVSQDKLIKQGIKYTDSLFDEITKRLEQGVKASDTLEAFLDKYHKAFPDKDNPLITLGYDKEMLKIILSETNNHKFSRPAQKELVRVTIENRVGENIVDVGDEIRDSVREIVKDGYNNNLSQDKIAENISSKVSGIKNRRARAIARTEIARAATVSDYIINKEMGATHFYVECRNTACPICKAAWHKGWTIDSDDSFKPSDTSANGKGWIGDNLFSMNQTDKLPPIHPNCRCVPYFISDGSNEQATSREPTPEEFKRNLKATERAKYRNYQKAIQTHENWLRGNPNANADEIASHRSKLSQAKKKLEELKVKAIGGNTPKTTSVPEITPKPQTETEVPIPTSKQLKENLTPQELRQYRRYLKEIKAGKMSDEMIARRKRDVENFRRKALGLAPLEPKATPKPKSNAKPKAVTPTETPEPSEPVKTKSKPSTDLETPFDKSKHLTKEQLDKMDFKELAEHHGATYKGIQENDYDGKKYHRIEQTCSNGETFIIHFEDSAVKSYTKGGIATSNEIIHEVFKVPEALRKETNAIWFKNSTKGLCKNYGKSLYDSLAKNEGGYNLSARLDPIVMERKDDPEHQIVINPNYFKRNVNRLFLPQTKSFAELDEELGWKHAVHHEFVHSGDKTRENYKKKLLKEISFMEEYSKIEEEEPWFTGYANMKRVESFAEHGGFIARMEANPSEQHRKIKIKVYDENRNRIEKEITYDEYKKMYPKHHAYFMKKFKEGF